MKRYLLILAILMIAPSVLAQNTTVSGTITDSGGQTWTNGSFQIQFFPGNNQPPFFFNGAPFNSATRFNGVMDGSGHFTQVVPDNNFITPANTQWTFTVCPNANSQCFSTTLKVSGASQNVTSSIIPPAIVVQGNSYNQPTAYADSEIAGPTWGFIYYNTSSNQLRQCNGPLPCTWTAVTGGGAGNPSPPNLSFQYDNGGVFGGSSLLSTDAGQTTVTDSGILSVTGVTNVNGGLNSSTGVVNLLGDLDASGQNPWIDIRSAPYFARAVGAVPSTTANCQSGNTTVGLTAASTFQNNDGITLGNCGATNTLSTPVISSVNPTINRTPTGMQVNGSVVLGAAGPSNYQYQVAAMDIGGGVTAASAVFAISNGQSTLGATTATISGSPTRSNDIVTINTTAPTDMGSGQMVCISGADATLNGCFGGINGNLTVINSSQFTIQTGYDTRAGAATTLASGGTITYIRSNSIVWGNVGAFEYCVYGRVSGSMAYIGQTVPGNLSFQDYGPTYGAPPAGMGCPATPPGSTTNDNLTTTIVSGAPSTSIVVANAPINSNATATATFDDAPAILAAAQAAAQNGGSGTTHGTLRIPATPAGTSFVVNSYLPLDSLSDLHVSKAGCLTLNWTMATGSFIKWDGEAGSCSTTSSFVWDIGSLITVSKAYPGIYSKTNTTTYWTNTQLNVPNQGVGYVSANNSGFNQSFDSFSCTIGSGGNNFDGLCFLLFGNANMSARKFALSSSSPASLYGTLTPAMILRDDTAGTVPQSGFHCEECYLTHVGIAAVSITGNGGQQFYSYREGYTQGMVQPAMIHESQNNSSVYNIIGFTSDTTSAPLFTNLGTGNLQLQLARVSPTSSVFISGNKIASEFITNSSVGSGQSAENSICSFGTMAGQPPWNTRNLTNYGFCVFNEQVLIGAGKSLYIPLPQIQNLSAVASSGGAVPAGGQNYTVGSLSADGGITNSSPVTCPTVTGTQTCTISWNGVTGDTLFTVYRSGLGVIGCENIAGPPCVDSTGGVDGGNRPGSIAGGGLVSLTPAGLFSPQVVLSAPIGSGTVSFTGTDVPLPLTANRVWNDPDATGQRCVTGLVGCDAFTDTGVANAYVACSTPAVSTIPDGFQVTVQIANSSTGPSTLNFCSTGAKTIKKNGGTGVLVGADLSANDLKAGGWYTFNFDTTNWQVMSQLGNVSGGGTVGITGSPVNGNLTKWSSGNTITNADLTGDVTTSGTSVTTIANIKGTPVNCTTAAVGQLLTIISGPQYQCIYPGVNYNAQTADYTLVCPTPDRLGYVDFVGTDTLNHVFTLPQAGSTACLQSSVSFIVSNHSNRSEPTTPVTLTLKATTSNIDGIAGATGIPLTAGESRFIYSDAVSGTGNYHTVEMPASDGGINTQTGSYTATLSDWNKTVLMNCTAACTFTVPNPPPVGKWKTNVMSIGSTLATVSLNALNFNGSASVPVLNSFQALEFRTDGSNYFGSAPLVASTNVTFTPSSNGLAISSSGGGGGSTTIQTNGVNNTTQTTLNFQTTSGVSGITATNPSAGNEQFAIANVQGSDAKVLSASSIGTTAYPLTADANAGASSLSLVATTLTDGATVTWAIGSVFEANASLTFTVHSGSRTLNITNPLNGGTYLLKLVQDATGGEGLTLGTGCTWKVINGGGGAVTLSTGANAQDLLTFYFDGTNCYANLGKNYN